ncbi:hypothetical protein [Bradyrhizobium sp. SZCCHNS1054]|uniref:DUF4376 domain-containing protein n=1 Tax=Bradyrhizobium sp. SZCCHNS1054 TaxID=3057301 RepID=UPI002916DA55|nr:hypothetical protein [Bradyrhizobium sp. SZCCHNS1054]
MQMLSRPINYPSDWYWIASNGNVYSSARQLVVTAEDAAYVAWLAAGNIPTIWPKDDSGGQTIAALQDVLTTYGLFADLVAYANARQWAKATVGYAVTVNGAPITISTTSESLGLITGKVARLQQPNPPAAVTWQTGPTSFVSIPAADFTTLATEVADFVQSTFDKLATALAGIAAGTITTQAAVDAALA